MASFEESCRWGGAKVGEGHDSDEFGDVGGELLMMDRDNGIGWEAGVCEEEEEEDEEFLLLCVGDDGGDDAVIDKTLYKKRQTIMSFIWDLYW